jgi:hypothetical protein
MAGRHDDGDAGDPLDGRRGAWPDLHVIRGVPSGSRPVIE